MSMIRVRLARSVVACVALAGMLSADIAQAGPEVFVQPRRPGQTNVRHFDFDWQTIEILTEPAAEGNGTRGGVRMYFYERERDVAERATAIVEEGYAYLTEEFGATPEQTFPFVLYSSYQEFLRTNLFPLGEGVLGVTSTRDLTLTLPWFGDERLFRDVFVHELAHQFMIQEVQGAGRDAETFADPLHAMPLWFVEGLAEYYAQGGLNDEAAMVALDLVVHPRPEYRYGLHDFFEDRPWDVRWTYRMGQVRCTFLQQTYGDETLQEILERSPALVGARGTRAITFEELVRRVTGDEREQIDAKFEAWLKQNAFQSWLDAEQQGPQMEPVADLEHADALASSPDGNMLMIRLYDPERGVSRLKLVDPRNAEDTRTVVTDGRPGVESLHPVAERTFDLTNDSLVYVAESNGRDVLYVQTYRARAKQVEERDDELPRSGLAGDAFAQRTLATDPKPEPRWDVRVKLGNKERFALVEEGLVGAFAPSFSPDGRRIAFIGLDLEGTRDVYVLEPLEGEQYTLTRMTDDPFAERDLDWGPDGIVYSSSATDHGFFNLFRVNPGATDVPERLTTEPRDHEAPLVLPDGRVFYTAWDEGHHNLWELVGGEAIRRTDVTTGLFQPTIGPGEDVWALWYRGGLRRPTRVKELLAADVVSQGPGAPAEPPPKVSLDAAQPYQPLDIDNWGIDGIFGFAGGGAGGVFGQVLLLTSDELRNHTLTLDVAMYGSPELTDGYILYANQANRITWGTGPYHFLRYRMEEEQDIQFVSIERFFGGLGTARYPLNRFMYLQADVALGGSTGFLFDDTAVYLANPDLNSAGEDLLTPWLKEHGDVEFQTELTGRFGIDTVGYHVRTGPLTGGSVLLEGLVGSRPFDERYYASARLDAARFFPITGAMNFFVQGGAGTSLGPLARSWWLQSTDTLRGVPFGDPDWLVGRHYTFATAEAQVPLDAIVRLAFISNLEGIVGVDAGGVADEWTGLWDRRVLDVAVGTNIILGSLVFRVHFARPIDVGAPLPTGPEPRWVTNLSMDWLYN